MKEPPTPAPPPARSVADALNTAQAAKADYRRNPGHDSRAEHRTAAVELRYQRWLARGGPALEAERRWAQDARREALRASGVEPEPVRVNGEVAAMYERWLHEDQEG